MYTRLVSPAPTPLNPPVTCSNCNRNYARYQSKSYRSASPPSGSLVRCRFRHFYGSLRKHASRCEDRSWFHLRKCQFSKIVARDADTLAFQNMTGIFTGSALPALIATFFSSRQGALAATASIWVGFFSAVITWVCYLLPSSKKIY